MQIEQMRQDSKINDNFWKTMVSRSATIASKETRKVLYSAALEGRGNLFVPQIIDSNRKSAKTVKTLKSILS